jgi:hypothetical protein
MTTTVLVPEALTTQQTELTTKLAEIVKQQTDLAAQKIEVETSLRRIDTAIRFLKGEVVIPVAGSTGRKQMSEEGKANIRAGLIASAARKKAATEAASAVSQAPQIAETPSAPAPAPVSPADTKGGKKAAK